MNRRNFIRLAIGSTAAVACGVGIAETVKLPLFGMYGVRYVPTGPAFTFNNVNNIDCVATYPQTYQEANVSKDTLYKNLRGHYGNNNYTYQRTSRCNG